MTSSAALARTLLVAAITAIAATLLPVSATLAQTQNEPSRKPSLLGWILGTKQDENGGWLFVGSKKTGEAGLYMAISKDGYNWAYVSEGKPIIRQSERNELMLDPFVQRDPDGTFHMVWIWSTSSPAIGYASSNDLLHWTKNRRLPITASIPGVLTASSPSVYYRESKKDWLILWTSSVASTGGGSSAQDRIYYSTTTDFKQFTPAALFFDPGYSVTDANLLGSGMPGLFYLLFQDERTNPLQRRIYAAEGPSTTGPWQRISEPITAPWTEAPAAIQTADGLLIYYHRAQQHAQNAISHDPEDYGAAFTKDMAHWDDESLRISFPSGIHHGSFINITTDEYSMLHHFFLRFDTGLPK
ncbi:MAG: hypothetical protein ABSG84_04375 [Acidobacteriaceae bacterium]